MQQGVKIIFVHVIEYSISIYLTANKSIYKLTYSLHMQHMESEQSWRCSLTINAGV